MFIFFLLMDLPTKVRVSLLEEVSSYGHFLSTYELADQSKSFVICATNST